MAVEIRLFLSVRFMLCVESILSLIKVLRLKTINKKKFQSYCFENFNKCSKYQFDIIKIKVPNCKVQTKQTNWKITL